MAEAYQLLGNTETLLAGYPSHWMRSERRSLCNYFRKYRPLFLLPLDSP
jgi:hypothetical protein